MSETAPQRKSRLRRYIVEFLVALLVLYLGVCAFIYLRQDQIGFPILAEYEKVTPMDVGILFEDLHIPVNGSEQIHAWWIPGRSDKVLLAFHGSGYVLEDNITGALRSKSGLDPLPRLPGNQMDLLPLHQLGVNVLGIDYRGFGSSSPVNLNEKRANEDARAAFTYLTVQRRVPSRDVFLSGGLLAQVRRPRWLKSIPMLEDWS
jgi:uncharacterized protein